MHSRNDKYNRPATFYWNEIELSTKRHKTLLFYWQQRINHLACAQNPFSAGMLYRLFQINFSQHKYFSQVEFTDKAGWGPGVVVNPTAYDTRERSSIICRDIQIWKT